MFEVLKTYRSRKTGRLLHEGESLPDDYYTKKELEEAIKGGFIKEVKPEKKPTSKAKK